MGDQEWPEPLPEPLDEPFGSVELILNENATLRTHLTLALAALEAIIQHMHIVTDGQKKLMDASAVVTIATQALAALDAPEPGQRPQRGPARAAPSYHRFKCRSCDSWVDTPEKRLRQDKRCYTCYMEIHEGVIPEQTPSKLAKGTGGGIRIIRKPDGLGG